MKAMYNKETLPDPQDSNNTYENFILDRKTEFCCEEFRSYCKKFTGWDYNKGKFVMVDKITYEGNSTIAINFCPFCGQKIEYEIIKTAKKVK